MSRYVRFCAQFGVGVVEEQVLEFEDNATDKEIDETLSDWVLEKVDSFWIAVDEDGEELK